MGFYFFIPEVNQYGRKKHTSQGIGKKKRTKPTKEF
jgi:hypothetical protein